MSIRRIAVCVAAFTSLLVVRPVAATEPVITDPVGDATATECTVVCTSVGSGESHPISDIVAVEVVPSGRELGVEVGFLDIDRAIPLLDVEEGVIWTEVSFRLGNGGSYRSTTVNLSVRRDFDGELTSPDVAVTVGTSGSDNVEDFFRRLVGSASIDRAANRLRMAVSLDELHRVAQEMCSDCGSFSPGETFESFFAHSNATRVYSVGVPLTGVARNVARDTGWPTASYTL